MENGVKPGNKSSEVNPLESLSKLSAYPGMIEARQEEERKKTQAFNEGCDARIAGAPSTSNPHGKDESLRIYWLMGWRDVDKFWGSGARQPAKKLLGVAQK